MILITGGARGIGREIVRRYEAEGAKVLAPARQELDLASLESIRAFVSEYKDAPISAIINNAGINPLNYIDEIEEEDLYECVQVNLLAPALLIRGLIGHMKRQKKGQENCFPPPGRHVPMQEAARFLPPPDRS